MKLIVVLLNLAFLHISLALVNVVSGVTATYCNKHLLTNGYFDGVTDPRNGDSFTDKCRENAYIEIKTKEPYYVHYFVIYRGYGPDKDQMKFLRVEMYMSSEYVVCGEHYLPTSEYNVGVRINCPPKPKLQWFKIQSHVDEGFHLSEVEMYYLGENATKIYAAHLGCHRMPFSSRGRNSTTLDQCIDYCSLRFPYAGMKAENVCYCAKEIQEHWSARCYFKCQDSNKTYGGLADFSVYLVNFRLPYYEGCYMRTDLSAAVIEGDDMTPGKCLQICELQKLAWLSKGNKCQCDNNMGNARFQRESCTAPCKGDSNTRCGSLEDNIYSVWRGCINNETKSVKCSVGLRCDGLYNGYGICLGSCKAGFTGQHCLNKEHNPTQTMGSRKTKRKPTTAAEVLTAVTTTAKTTSEATATELTTLTITSETTANTTSETTANTTSEATANTTSEATASEELTAVTTSEATASEELTAVTTSEATASEELTAVTTSEATAAKKLTAVTTARGESEAPLPNATHRSLCTLNQFIIMLIEINNLLH